MSNVLYFPKIDFPETHWAARALLYYDNVSSIVPREFIDNPRSHSNYMVELLRCGLVLPIDPQDVLRNRCDTFTPFIEFISDHPELNKLRYQFHRQGRRVFPSKFPSHTHSTQVSSSKFSSEVFYILQQLELASQDREGWFLVESTTADLMMYYLAELIADKTNLHLTTDKTDAYNLSLATASEGPTLENRRKHALDVLMPMPAGPIGVDALLNFKHRHGHLAGSFRNKVEQIILEDRSDKEFFLMLAEMSDERDELVVRMQDLNVSKLIFSKLTGFVAAGISVAQSYSQHNLLWAIPGFAHAIYSALQTNRSLDNSPRAVRYTSLLTKRFDKFEPKKWVL